jgi:tetratricopeptide (TPR) repeat protein
MKILRAAEAIRRLKLGPDDPVVAHSLLNLGIVNKDLKMYDDAEQSLLSARKIFAREKRPELESYIAQCNSNLATIYMATNRPDLAEPLLQALVQSCENSDTTDPQQLASCQYRYAIALARQGKYDVAQPLMERTLNQQRKLLGPAHADTIKTMSAYALLLKTTRQTEAAEKIYNQIRQVSYESDTNDFQR